MPWSEGLPAGIKCPYIGAAVWEYAPLEDGTKEAKCCCCCCCCASADEANACIFANGRGPSLPLTAIPCPLPPLGDDVHVVAGEPAVERLCPDLESLRLGVPSLA